MLRHPRSQCHQSHWRSWETVSKWGDLNQPGLVYATSELALKLEVTFMIASTFSDADCGGHGYIKRRQNCRIELLAVARASAHLIMIQHCDNLFFTWHQRQFERTYWDTFQPKALKCFAVKNSKQMTAYLVIHVQLLKSICPSPHNVKFNIIHLTDIQEIQNTLVKN